MKTKSISPFLLHITLVTASIFLSLSHGYAQTGQCEIVQEIDRVEKVDTVSYRAAGPPSLVAGFVQPKSFCRYYQADKLTISKIIAQILPNIGNPPKLMDIQNGIFTTESMARAHLTPWEDSYYVTVSQEADGRSLVRVHRTLFVYSARRDPRATRPARPIPSDGHNERWLLAQIGDRLVASGGSKSEVSSGADRGSIGGDQEPKATAAGDAEKKLMQLQQLREKKLISEEEYQSHRRQVLEHLMRK